MPYHQIDRSAVRMKPLARRANKKDIERDCVLPDQKVRKLPMEIQSIIDDTAVRIVNAREKERSVMLTFGAHTIKNGLAPVLIQLMEKKWITHFATNGAGVIHDWEFAFQGKTSEDVRTNMSQGEFGNWQETGFNINLALNIGAYEGKGYGEAVGAMIENEGVEIPSEETLQKEIAGSIHSSPCRCAGAADVLDIIKRFDLPPGFFEIKHPWKRYSVQGCAYRLGIPFTSHPMFGHDIIYNHPMNLGASIGRTAERDFLTFAESVSHIDRGVYLSVGSSVMSPMVFEKSFSMAQNLAIQQGEHIDNHYILVVDLNESSWDWQQGEPPEDHPDYYLRYNKSFSRMGGQMRYITIDNRDFLLALFQALKGL